VTEKIGVPDRQSGFYALKSLSNLTLTGELLQEYHGFDSWKDLRKENYFYLSW